MEFHIAPDPFEAKAVIGELDFVLKQYLQLDDVSFVVKSSVEDDGKSFITKYGKDFFNYYKSVITAFYK